MSWMLGLRQRLRELFRRSDVAAEFDEELRDHLERELERQMHGSRNVDAARREALLRAGPPHAAREAVADGFTGRVLADVARDIRIGVRGIRRNRGLAAAVVMSLTLGIGGTTTMFSVVHAVLLRPLPFPKSEELHTLRVWWNDFSSSLSVADLLTLSEATPLAGRVAAYYLPDSGFAMATPSGPAVVEGGMITPDLLRVLGVAPLLGPGFSTEPDAREALIAESLWQELFDGDPAALGASLTLDGEAFTVIGVMPAGFNLPGRYEDRVWVRANLRQPRRRGPFFLTTIVRVPADGAPAAAAAETGAAHPVLRERYGVAEPWRYGVRPLQAVLVGDARQMLLVTFAAVSVVLLIAVANVANLLLARGAVRAREMAVRASLGAGRGRLIRQLLAESAVLGVTGGAAGLAVAALLTHVARTEAQTIIPRAQELGLNVPVVVFALAAGLAAGIAAGLLPILRVPWTRLGDWLHGGGRTGHGPAQPRARQVLVVGEIALAAVVLTSAALLVQSLLRVERTDPGFRPDHVLSFRLALPDSPYEEAARAQAFTAELERQLLAQPGVQSAALAMSLPPDLLVMSNDYTVEGAAPGSAGPSAVAEWNVVTPDYFPTLGIPLVRGRGFAVSDRADGPRGAVVNEAFVRRHFPDSQAIGRRLKGGTWDPDAPWTTIVGVAGDVPYENGVWNGAGPMVYTAYAQNLWLQSPFVVIRTAGDPAAATAAAREVVMRLDSRVPLRDVATMTERLHRSTAVPRFRGRVFLGLGVLALILAVTGIYGVMAYHVEQRRRETAIRRALGARGAQIVRAVFGTGMRLALVGIVVGTAAAFAVSRSLAALLYQVNPRDPAVTAGVGGVLAAAAAVACLWPALVALRVDPAMLLRDE